jgi:serine/threonine-protein kinase HipA
MVTKQSRHIQVAIGQKAIPVGELHFEVAGERQSSAFRYHTSWLERTDAFAIAPDLPLGQQSFYSSNSKDRDGLPSVMMDGAPDSWGRALIKAKLSKSCTDLDYLLESDDFTRIGALRYIDEEGVALAVHRKDSVPRLTDMEELIWAARSWDKDPTRYAHLRDQLVGASGSLGGARPKINVIDKDGRFYIAKLTSARDERAVERAEVMTLNLAKKVGIKAATARLVEVRNMPVALISRFDRPKDGRIHYASAQTFLGLQDQESGTYADLAKVIETHGHNPVEDKKELHQRLLFSILASNTDDHLRNHGFVYASGNKWRLSPAFDINPQPDRERMLKTGISLNHGHEPLIAAAIDAAPYFGVTHEHAQENVKRMATIIHASWKDEARLAGMNKSEIQSFQGAFDHPEMTRALAISVSMNPVKKRGNVPSSPAPGMS